MSETEKAAKLCDRSFPVTEEYVKLTGRTRMKDGIRWIIFSAGKAEFRMTGTRAAVTVCGDAAATGDDPLTRTRIAVYVNGKRTLDHMIEKAEETLEVFAAEEATDVTIGIIKLSEATNSVFGIKCIDVTSIGEIEPLPEKELKLEFIGDSITCGYGIDDEDENYHFQTATEDATRAYAYKTAMALDADYSLVSYSGHGIISGYTENGQRLETHKVPDVYEKLGKTYGSANGYIDLSEPWDFSNYVPDYIIINLGTNDSSYTEEIPERMEEFTAAYIEFLKMVRRNNPASHLVCALGVMDGRLCPCVEDAAKRYTAETGDGNLSTLRFTPHDGKAGYVADFHPTEKTNEIAAGVLIAHLRGLIEE